MAGQFRATEAMSAVNAVNGVSTEKQLAPATSKQQAITQKVQNDAGNLATEEHVKQEQEKNGLQLGEWKADRDNPGTLTRQLVNRNLTGKREDSSGTGSPAVSDYLENQRQLSTERMESPTFGNVYSSTDARESSLYGSKYADILSKSDYAEKSAPTGSKIKLIGTDQRYDYINDINGFRETADMNAGSGTGDTTLQKWALMTKDEVGVYNYLYNTKGKKEANNFLTELEPEINAQWASGINKTMEEAANKNAGTKALMTAATIAGAPVRGMAGAGALVEDAIRTASGRGIDPNSRLRQPTMVTQNIRESIAEPMGGVGQFLYNAGTAAGDSAMNMLVARGLGVMGGLTGKALMKMTNLITSTIMSSEVAAASVAESKNKGYSDLGAMSLGLTRGGIEWASEKVGGDWIIKNVKSNPLNLLKTVVLGMIPEGVEENMSDIGNEGVNLLVDLVCGTDESFIRRTFNYYKDAGAEHPVLETMKAVVQQELLSFAGGALATVGSSTVQSYNMRSAINESAQIMDATPLDVVNQMTELGTDNPYYAAFMNESAKKLNSTTEEVRQLMQDLDEDNPQVVSMLADLHEAKSMDELRQKVGQVQEESRAVDEIMAGAEQLKKTEQTAAVENKVNEAVNNMVTGAPAEPVTPAATTPTETGLQLQQEGEINEAIQQSTAPEEQGLSGPEPIRAGEGEPAGRGAEADIIGGGTEAGTAAAVSAGGPAVSGGSTGWDLGGRTGGQAGRVEQTAGTGSRVTADGERRRTVGENVRIALRERGLEAESTNSLGFTRGTDNGTFYTVPEDLQEQEWKDLAYGIRMNTGYDVQFIVGQMEVMGNDGKIYHVNGCCDHDNQRIIIRVDSEKYSARQLGKHEEFHALAQRDQGLVRAVRDQLADQYGREQMASIVKGYILKRRGINDIENGGQDAFTQEFDELWEELFADAYGGMNAFEMGANRYMGTVAGVVGDRRSWDRSRTPRGPPGLWRVKILEKERQDLMNRLSGLRREGDGYVDAKGKFYTEQQADKLASQIADRDEEIERLQQAARPGQTFSDETEETGLQYSLSEDDLDDYLKTGSRNNKAKLRALERGQKIILTTAQEIKTYIQQSIRRGLSNAPAAYGKVSDRLARDISEESNGKIDLTGMYEELNPYDLQHSYDQHHNPKEPGDVPLYDEDFENIPQYLENYDDVVYATAYDTGEKSFCVSKRLNQGRIIIIELVSKSRNAIQFKNAIGVSEAKYQNEILPKYGKSPSSSGGGQDFSLDDALRLDQAQSDTTITSESENGKQEFSASEEEWPEGTLVNRRAIVSEETLDQWLKDYAASNPEYAQAYIAYISPEKFLNLTTSGAASRYAIRQQSEGLTLPSVMDYSREQPIQLRINTETGKVEGHEGRHRMVALNRAGVEEVPVLLFDSSNKYGKQPMDSIQLIQQDFNNRENTGTEIVRDLEPLSTGNRDTVRDKFSKKDVYERMNEKYSGKKTVQFSASEEDSLGNQLTERQQEYFKESKIRDDKGRLKVMYRGGNSEISVFDRSKSKYSNLYGRGFYFTDSEEHANQYGTARSYYLDIRHPVQPGTHEIRQDEIREFLQAVADNEDYGLENYGYGATVDSVLQSLQGRDDFGVLQDINATAIGDFAAAIELFNETNGTDFDGIVVPTETVAFYSEQIKLTGNKNPTNSKDVRFSMSEEVEETDRLVAVHNKSVSGLRRMLERGGVPFPSIAIKKAGAPHEGFGDVSIVFPRSSIDPEVNRQNRIYSNDAWTPTEPRVEYDVGNTYRYQKKLRKQIGDELFDALRGSSYLEESELSNRLAYNKGNVVEALSDLSVLKYAYLQSIGETPEVPTRDQPLDRNGRFDNEQLQAIFNLLSEEEIANLKSGTETAQKVADILNFMYETKFPPDSKMRAKLKEKPLYDMEDIRPYAIRDAYQRWLDNGKQIVPEYDYYEFDRVMRGNDAIEKDEGYHKWMQETFKDLIVDEGIRNDKDLFTSSGNRRSFKQLHVPATLDNIVREMQKQEETGVGALGINLRGAATKAYKSVEDARSESGKLLGTHVSDEVYDSYMKEFYNRFHEIAVKAAGENAGIGKIDTTEEILLEAVRDSNTKRAMENKLQRESKWFNKYDGITDELWQLKIDVQNMPAPYFEAKPRRIVYPGEALAYILPDNADEDVLQMLEDRGYNVMTYKAGDNEDRLKKLNSVDNARFSVSEEDEDQITMDELTGGEYSLSGTEGPNHEWELAKVLASRAKDLLTGYEPEGWDGPITEEEIDEWMEPDAYHDRMANLFSDPDQVMDLLYEMSQDDPERKEEIFQLMDRIVRTMGPDRAQKYTLESDREGGLSLGGENDYAEFKRWFNERNPSLYYPGYQPGDLFDSGKADFWNAQEAQEAETEYLRSLIDDPNVSEETKKDAEEFLQKLENPENWETDWYDQNTGRMTKKRYREIFYSTDEDERRESTGEEELGEARLTDEEKTIEELRKDNDQLREYAEYWKKQGRITGKGENRAKRSDVQKLAKDLATHADYQGDKAELQQKLQDLANMIVSDDKGTGLSWTNVHEAASEIAELLVDNSYQMLDPEKDTRERLAARAKELKIRPDDMWTKDFGDWKEYRQKQFNKLVFNREGQDIDTVYQTLRSEFGDGMFPEDVTAGSDQVRRIVQVLDQLQPERAYSFASDEEAEMATAFYTNIIEDELLFGNIGEELTRADKNYQRVKERMAKAEEKVKKVREEKKDLQKMQRLEMRAALDEQRRNLNRREETQKVRKRIDKTAKRLLKWLDENAGKNPIPEPMKGPVGELLLSLDISGGMEKHQKERYLESMENVAKIVTRQFDYMSGQDDAWDGMYLDLPPDIRKTLDDHLESIRKAMRGEEKRGRVWNPNMMNLEELNQLDEILTTVSSAITSANEILSDERGKHISEMAAPTIQHLNELGSDKTRSSWRDKINNFMRFNNLTPYYFFKKLGPAGTEMFEKIQDGWDKFAFNARQIINFANETYTAKEAKEIQQKTETFQLRRKGDMSEGFDKPEKVTMTHAQIMSLYCLWKREQARGHIAGAGIRIADFKSEKGKEVKQAENYLIDLDDIAKITGTLSKREKEIADKLQKYMNTVGSDWGNEVSLRRFGIRSFTEDNYFPIETDDRTRPVRSPERDSTDLYRLLNMGFTKATVRNANNALVVNNIFDVFANHMADMAKYNGLGLPMLDTLKWFSYNQMGAADENGQYGYESIQKSLERAYGRHARNYFTSFIKDLNGVREGGHGLDLLSRAISNYKVAAVGANLRVAVLQPTSYARALAVLDKKYLAKGMKMDNKQGREEALKYSGTAVWKDLGFYDTNINAGLREMIKHDDGWKEKVQDTAMKPAEMGDKVTWGALWNACKAEQEDKGLKGEKLIEATAKRFREVVYRTQVMDSTMTRSHIMRQKDGLMTFYTAFMSEPTLSYNMMLDAYGEYEADRRKGMSKKDALKKNGKTMKMAGAAYLTTATLSAIVESLIDAARDDDEYASFLERLVEKLLGFNPKDPDETVWEKFKASLNGNLLDDLLLHNKLPLVKDLAGMLNGDNPGRMDTEWFGNIVKALNIWKETLGLQLGWQDEPTDATYNGNMTTWGKIYNTLRAASQITGLPLGNGIRDLVALWNTTVGEASKDMKIQTYDPGEEKKIKYAVKDGYLSEDEAVDWLMKYEVAEDEDEARQMVYVWAHPEKYERLLDAMNAGDMDEFNAAKEELRGLHFKPSSIEAAVKNEVHELYVGRDGEEPIDRGTAVQMLVDYGGMIQRKADELVQKWTSEIETGVGFDAIGDAYVAGDINREQAVQMLMLYGGYAQEKAEAKVQQWTSEIETGIGYNEIGDRFFYDEITKDEAIDMYMKYGGKSEEDALDAVNKVDFKKLTGHERERIELETMYMEGRYSRDEMKKIMVDYGYSKTEESAENSLIRWDFIGDNVEELDAVTSWQAKRYFEMVDDAEIDKKTYLQFAEQAEQLKADYDENGKAIAYSKMNKVFALIDSLDLTPEQKTALAEAGWDSNNDGYSEKNIEKYAPWEGGTPKNTTKKKSGGGGRRGGGGGRGGRGSSGPIPGTLELGSIVNTGHRGIFDQILAGWKRKKYSRAQILALVRTGKLTQEEADEILATKQEVEEETDGSLVLGG